MLTKPQFAEYRADDQVQEYLYEKVLDYEMMIGERNNVRRWRAVEQLGEAATGWPAWYGQAWVIAGKSVERMAFEKDYRERAVRPLRFATLLDGNDGSDPPQPWVSDAVKGGCGTAPAWCRRRPRGNRAGCRRRENRESPLAWRRGARSQYPTPSVPTGGALHWWDHPSAARPDAGNDSRMPTINQLVRKPRVLQRSKPKHPAMRAARKSGASACRSRR